MGERHNLDKIEDALRHFRRKKDAACLAMLIPYMKELTSYAMTWHDMEDPSNGKVHPFHSQRVEHDFGWCVCHGGQVVAEDMGYGEEVPGRYNEMFQMFATEAEMWYGAYSWVGYIVAIIEPLQTPTGEVLIYSPRFESWVFKNLTELAQSGARNAFLHAIHSIS